MLQPRGCTAFKLPVVPRIFLKNHRIQEGAEETVGGLIGQGGTVSLAIARAALTEAAVVVLRLGYARIVGRPNKGYRLQGVLNEEMKFSSWLQRAKGGARDVMRGLHGFDFGFTGKVHQHFSQRPIIVLRGEQRRGLQARHFSRTLRRRGTLPVENRVRHLGSTQRDFQASGNQETSKYPYRQR